MENSKKKQLGHEEPKKILIENQVPKPEEPMGPECQACGDGGSNALAYGAPCFCHIGE